MKKRREADFQKTSDALLAETSEHQRAEEALRASEQRLQDILDLWQTDRGIFFRNLLSGRGRSCRIVRIGAIRKAFGAGRKWNEGSRASRRRVS